MFYNIGPWSPSSTWCWWGTIWLKKVVSLISIPVSWAKFFYYFLFEVSMEQHVFYFSIDYRGRHRKCFKMPLKSVDNRNFGSIKQKCIFEHFRRFKNIKRSAKWHYLFYKTLVLFASSELPPIGLCLHYIKTCCSICQLWRCTTGIMWQFVYISVLLFH